LLLGLLLLLLVLLLLGLLLLVLGLLLLLLGLGTNNEQCRIGVEGGRLLCGVGDDGLRICRAGLRVGGNVIGAG
jgi:hypothetical protein